MEKSHERLQLARARAKYNTASEAARAFGWNEITYRAHENGIRGIRPEAAERYARAFGVDASWILEERGRGPSGNILPTPKRMPIVPAPQLGNDLIPILGRALGGEGGRLLFSGDPVGYVGRPEVLAGVPGAYATYYDGDSMWPRYKPGELLWIQPDRPPRKGDDVLVQLRSKNDGEFLEGYIKEFVAWTPTLLILTQHNPKIEITFPRELIRSVHFVRGHLSP